KLYHLIALRFISAFYPDCVFMSTTVLGEVDKIGFKATGKVIVEPGWRTVYGNQQDDDSQSEDKILPPFVVGESGQHVPSLLKKQTQPPKPYTEGTLLRAMESAGKTVEDEELREAMKENGIGRPSTRAAIIETLFKRRYIFRERKNIKASQAGIDLIATINEELLKSAKLTGLWENKLRRIERGEFSAADFIAELKTLINEIVLNVLNDNSSHRINVEDAVPEKKKKAAGEPAKKRQAAPRSKSFEDVKCPVCVNVYILKGKTAYGCSCFKDGCNFRIDFNECGPELTPARVATYIKKKYKQ
ncbi:MAG: DNA topoisomerase III, partial [Muribaculum sp.]|nr:DNA topoisomerase III [Muribaculum sp.]